MKTTTFALTALFSIAAASAESIFFAVKNSDHTIEGPISSIHEGAGFNYFLVDEGATCGEVFDLENGIATNMLGNFVSHVGEFGPYLAAGPAVTPFTFEFDGDTVDNLNFWACKNTSDPYNYSLRSWIIAFSDKDNDTAPFEDCCEVWLCKECACGCEFGSSSFPISSSSATLPSSSVIESSSTFSSLSSSMSWSNISTVTTQVTVTGFTTVCPASTLVTITTCVNHKCNPTTITVVEATTLTITEECLVSTTFTTTQASTTTLSESSSHSKSASVSSVEGRAAKSSFGIAGIAGILALMI